MNRLRQELFTLTEKEEMELFKNAYIFFDTSVLLDFYNFSDSAKKEIIDNVFSLIKTRLWITKQTEFEFNKNREKVSTKPIEKYNNLVSKNKNSNDQSGFIYDIEAIIDQINKENISNIEELLRSLHERTSKHDKHPFLESETINNFQQQLESFKEHSSNLKNDFLLFRKNIEDEINKKNAAIKQSAIDNSIPSVFENLFKVTNDLSYTEIIDLIKEGEVRYRNEIPPGYLDSKNKIGFQKYGDLILWKQIVRQSKVDGKDVILIINDFKEDWWYYQEKRKPVSPRNELIKEMKDLASANFWMLDINSFLFKSKKYLDASIQENTIEEIKNAVQPRYIESTPLFTQENGLSERTIKSSYTILGYRSKEVRDHFAGLIKLQNDTIKTKEIKPVLLPILLKSIFLDIKLGDLIHFTKNKFSDEYGHFAGFRKNDLGITMHYVLRRRLNIIKGTRYTTEINGSGRRINFIG